MDLDNWPKYLTNTLRLKILTETKGCDNTIKWHKNCCNHLTNLGFFDFGNILQLLVKSICQNCVITTVPSISMILARPSLPVPTLSTSRRSHPTHKFHQVFSPPLLVLSFTSHSFLGIYVHMYNRPHWTASHLRPKLKTNFELPTALNTVFLIY